MGTRQTCLSGKPKGRRDRGQEIKYPKIRRSSVFGSNTLRWQDLRKCVLSPARKSSQLTELHHAPGVGWTQNYFTIQTGIVDVSAVISVHR